MRNPMKFANVRELKAKTSAVLRTVKNGNTVLITTHGRPTAMVVPVSEDDIEDALLAHSPVLRKKIQEGAMGQQSVLYVIFRYRDNHSSRAAVRSEEHTSNSSH